MRRKTGFGPWGPAAAIIAAGLGLWLTASPSSADSQTTLAAASAIPRPHQVQSRARPLAQARTALIPFETAPFPYRGPVPGSEKPFLDLEENGRLGRTTPFGRVYWEDETYGDSRVLLHIPKGYDVRRPSVIVVFFHGHGATLERDVLRRQRVAEQVSRSGANAVLIAPQLAVDAADSSAGHFWRLGGFGRFMGEAATRLAKLHGDPLSARTFAAAPVVFVAYSGGYLAAAASARHGGLGKRLRGVVLLDALYGEIGTFASWIENDPDAFFISAYLGSTRERNAELAEMLSTRNIHYTTELQPVLGGGQIALLEGGEDVTHRGFVTRAWTSNPVEDLLRRLQGYGPRTSAHTRNTPEYGNNSRALRAKNSAPR